MKKCVFLTFLFLVLLTSTAYGKTLNYYISATSDDATSTSISHEHLTSQIGVDVSGGNNLDGFLRFSVQIPKNATITSAYIELVGQTAHTSSCSLNFKLIDEDNCAVFTTNAWSRSVTAESVAWTVPSTVVGTTYTSPDISSLIQAYIGRGGYSYGNYIGIRLVQTSAGLRRYYSYSGAPTSTQRPKLIVNYTGGDGVIVKYMAYPHSRTKQYVDIHLWNQDAGDKLYVTLDTVNQAGYPYTILSGDVPANAGEAKEFRVLFDYTSFTAGAHTISVQLKTSGEAARGPASEKSWTTLHNGYPKVGIDENDNLCIKNNGSCDKFFAITTFQDPSYTGLSLSHPLIQVTNSNWYRGYKDSVWRATGDKAFLDWGAANNFRFSLGGSHSTGEIIPYVNSQFWKDRPNLNNMAHNNSDCVTPTGYADCSAVNYLKGHNGLLLWVFDDESNLGTYWGKAYQDSGEYQGVQQRMDAIKANDTNNPVGNLIMGIGNQILEYYADYWKLESYGHYTNRDNIRPVTTDVWNIDYYPYEYRYPLSRNYLLDLCETIDRSYYINKSIYPVWLTIESTDLHDVKGYVSGGWVAATSYVQNQQIVSAGKLYRQTVSSCTSGGSPPSFPATIGDTVNDNTCTWSCEGTYVTNGAALNITTWDSGTFQVGERVCAYVGGVDRCDIAGAFIGRPRIGSSETSASYIRTPAALNGYNYNQLVFSSRDGTFTISMQVRGQTSGALATTPASSLWYREGGSRNVRSEDWTPPPTGEQLYNAVWLGIIHGAKGITYFNLFTPTPAEVYAAMGTIKSRITALQNALFAPVSTKSTPVTNTKYSAATVDSGYRVDYTVREYSNTIFVFAARALSVAEGWPNPANSTSITARMNVTGLVANTTITVYGEDRTIQAQGDGYFEDTLTQYGTHIYYYEGTGQPSYNPPERTISATQNFSCPGVTGDATWGLTTTNAATCKWHTSDVVYDSMANTFSTTGGTTHQSTSTGLTCGSQYTRYVRCMDGYSGDKNDTSVSTILNMQTSPIISNTAPSGTIECTTNPRDVFIGVNTNHNSTCKWDTSDVAYGSMANTFTSTGGTYHTDTLTSLSCFSNYTRYVRCSTGGVPNTSSELIEFLIGSPIRLIKGTGSTTLTIGTGSATISW